MRKKRPPANYVLTLEKRIDVLQKFYSRLSAFTDPVARSQFFDANMSSVALQLEEAPDSPPAAMAQTPSNGEAVLTDLRGSRSPRSASPAPLLKIRPVYGPTSVYHNEAEMRPKLRSQEKDAREMATLKAFAKNFDILHCLKLFFTWQYPNHNMFVFREAFFTDFFNPKPHSLYCLLDLVLSICALGSRMSDVDTIYSRSISYYNEAKSSLLSNLDHPSISAVQSFLLLAFYDICNGHNSAGWMLLGNAMRMGFDLGFQLHPEVWFLNDRGALKELDVSIRSRIYWGCFMADHFISLVLGRPSLLKSSDASIPDSEDLPELDWINEYKYLPENVTNILDPLKNIINLINISDNMLSDIFTKSDTIDSTNDHANDDYNLISRLSKLFEYNAQIMQWKEKLPQDLNWDRESLRETADNPTISVVRYYYYILLLCLNRPFVGIIRDFKEKSHLAPSSVCFSAIEDLFVGIQKFELSHGLRRASIFIVYCSILSISVILLTSTTSTLDPTKKMQLRYFLNVLAGCSKTWKLAEKSYKMIESKLRLQFPDDPDFRIQMTNDAVRKARSRKPLKPAATSVVKPQSDSATSAALDTSVKIENTSPSEFTGSIDVSRGHDPYRESVSQDMVAGRDAAFAQPDFESMTNQEEASTEFFGGPPVLMTSDLFNEDWEALFPDSIFNHK